MEKERVAESAFGALLRRHRLAAGLSQEMLAERARMSVNGISALERGDRQYPYRDTVALLTKALNLAQPASAEFEAAAARPRQPRARVDHGSAATDGRAPTNLPSPRTSLVGREAEIADIVGVLQKSRLVTVTGAGGVGKTRTALAVGDALVAETKAGVWLVELAPLAQGSFMSTTVAQVLNVQETPNRPLLETLLSHLKQKSLLLILDNCEHVIAEAASLADALLRGCPQLRILATSREPLRIAGEQTYRLPSLPFPTRRNIAQLSAAGATEYAAVVLFVERAPAIDRGFVLSDENAPVVAEICRRLDGIPLAIELAAVRIEILSPRQLRDRLTERFRVLTGGGRDAFPRHQTMRALIDWSHDLLNDRERTLFRRLAIFVNGFTLDGAVAVGSDGDLEERDILDLVASLVDKSLVMAAAEGDTFRYRLLESTRAYAMEQLVAVGERELLAGRHLRYLRDEFDELGARYEQSALSNEIEDRLTTELDDVRSALDEALQRFDLLAGAELLAAIASSWGFIGFANEGMARTEMYLTALPASASLLRTRLLSALSASLVDSGQTQRALSVATEAVAHARATGDTATLAEALTIYSWTCVILGRINAAQESLTEAEATSEASVVLRLKMLGSRAFLTQMRGDLDAPACMYERICEEHRSLGDSRGELGAATNLAELEHARGQIGRAISLVREALRAVRAGRAPHLLPILLENLAGYLAEAEDLSGAAAAAREAIEIRAGREPDHARVAVSIEHLALVFALRSDLGRAAALEGYAETVFNRHGFRRESTEAATHDRPVLLLHNRLKLEELRQLSAEGAKLTTEEAVTLALE